MRKIVKFGLGRIQRLAALLAAAPNPPSRPDGAAHLSRDELAGLFAEDLRRR